MKTSVDIEQYLLDFIDEQIKDKKFGNRTHAIEYALTHLKKHNDKGEYF